MKRDTDFVYTDTTMFENRGITQVPHSNAELHFLFKVLPFKHRAVWYLKVMFVLWFRVDIAVTSH